MTAKRQKTRSVSSQEVLVFINKAGEFLRKARSAQIEKEYNAAGLLAVHAAISACDAVTGHHGNVRSSSEDHRQAVSLLEGFAPQEAKEWKSQATRLGRIISKKNIVAYEGRYFSPKEASQLVEQAERFVDWAKEVVPD